MKTIKKISILLLIVTFVVGCEKKETFPTYEAKGTVLGVTGSCRGNGTYIEVQTPKDIGKEGLFSEIDDGKGFINYKNAISVPHFYKVGLPIRLQKKGTWFHFEYREYNSDKDAYLFQDEFPCTLMQGPPPANRYIITKIISYKTKN